MPSINSKAKSSKKAWKSKCGLIIFFFVGLLLMAMGITVILGTPTFLQHLLGEMLPLHNASASFKAWSDPPAPIYMQFWMFDVKNPVEVVKNGAKPVVEQIGPYTYHEIRHKRAIQFHDNGTVSFRENKSFVFDRDMSAGLETDTFTNVNLPMVVVGEKVKRYPAFLDFLIGEALKYLDHGLFVKHSVHDIIWGYVDPALEDLSRVASIFGIHIDPHVGMFYNKNDTDDGLYTIYTGSKSLTNFAEITHWNGATTLKYWTSKSANMINGTDGTMFPPTIKKDKTLYLFASDICRSLYLKYTGSESVREIPTFRFEPPSEVFGNVTTNPANKGFCTPNCLGSGVLNMSNCLPEGVPAILSQPHFYQADDRYLHGVDGMHPSHTQCTTFIDVEPNTGLVLNASKKLQLNIALEPIPGFDETTKITPPLFLPLLWLNESAAVDEATAAQLRNQLTIPLLAAYWTSLVAAVLGGLVILISCLTMARRKVHKEERTPLLSGETSETASSNGVVFSVNDEEGTPEENHHG